MSLPHIKLADVLFAHRNIVTYGDAVRIAKAIEQLTKQNSSTADMMFEEAWIGIANVLSDIDPDWGVGEGRIMDRAVNFIRLIAEQRNACQAQQRENAETIKALTERAETAEAANTELDNARKSAEQSARDLRENNATLRAELDAIKGAQVPYRWTVVGKDRMSFTFTSLGSAQTWANGEGGEVIPLYRHPAPPHNPFAAFIDALKADRDMQWYYHCNVAMAACDKGVPHDQANAAAFLFMERLLGEYTPLHAIPEYTPAPALPVVVLGEVFVFPVAGVKHVSTRWIAPWDSLPEGRYEFTLGAPLPTEGGK